MFENHIGGKLAHVTVDLDMPQPGHALAGVAKIDAA